MCLSKVYLGEKNKDKIIIDEASRVIDNNGAVEVYSIFGEVSRQEGYFIKEVDLEDNFIILKKRIG
jgi:predicted RNA-binding protein